jgi:hypothetical protein
MKKAKLNPKKVEYDGNGFKVIYTFEELEREFNKLVKKVEKDLANNTRNMEKGTRVNVYDSRLLNGKGTGIVARTDYYGPNDGVLVDGPKVIRRDEFWDCNEIIVNEKQCRKVKSKL